MTKQKKSKNGYKKPTCPFLSIGKVGDSISVCSNEQTARVFAYTECSMPSIEMKLLDHQNLTNIYSTELIHRAVSISVPECYFFLIVHVKETHT